MWWRKKSLYLFVLSISLATIVWLQMGMFLTHLVFGTQLKMNFFRFCLSLFMEDSFYYFLVIFLFNTLLAYILFVTVIKIIKQIILSQRFYKKIKEWKDHDYSRFISEKHGRLENIIVVKNSNTLAFTMGFIKPSIVLSTGLIQMLEEDELKAVIEHESFHQNNHDPLKIFILELIAHSLWFIPLTKWCHQNYTIISEILADEHAIKKLGSQLELSSALLKLITYAPAKPSPTLVHFSGGSINYRLQQLVEPKQSIPVKLTSGNILISIHVLLFFMGMVLLTIA